MGAVVKPLRRRNSESGFRKRAGALRSLRSSQPGGWRNGPGQPRSGPEKGTEELRGRATAPTELSPAAGLMTSRRYRLVKWWGRRYGRPHHQSR